MFRKLLAALLLLLLPTVAHADWYEASTPHFVVYSEQRPEQLQKFAGELERFDRMVRRFSNMSDAAPASPQRVTIYVVGSRAEVEKLIGRRNVGGFYKPRSGDSFAVVPRNSGSGLVTDLDAQSILLHEYTHHLTKTGAPHLPIPAWYMEGLAEFFATADFEKNGSISIGRPPQYRARGLMSGNALPAEMLFSADSRKLTPQQRDGLYGRGWLLTHYLIVGQQRKGQLRAYFVALNSGKPPLEAATAAFGDLRALDRELEKYKLTRLAGFNISSADFADAQVGIRKLRPGEAATMDVRIRSKNGHRAVAADIYADAKKAAAPYADDAAAQTVLAQAAYWARDHEAAIAAADRAIAADPRYREAYVYKAMAQLAELRKKRDRGSEGWLQLRRTVAAGSQVEADDPRLLTLYYRSFVDGGSPPSDVAKARLRRAFELAPQDPMLRFNTARMLLASGSTREARAALAPLAYEPHGGPLAQRASRLIERIDAGQAEAAAKELDGEDAKEAAGED